VRKQSSATLWPLLNASQFAMLYMQEVQVMILQSFAEATTAELANVQSKCRGLAAALAQVGDLRIS
jgi:hypothetical protein